MTWELLLKHHLSVYPLVGKIYTSSISNQNYKYDITFTPNQFITSSFVCYHKTTKVLCLIDSHEKFVPIYEIRPSTLVKTLGQMDNFVQAKYIVSKTIYNNPNIKNKINKLYIHENENFIFTGGHSLLQDSLNENQNCGNKENMV